MAPFLPECPECGARGIVGAVSVGGQDDPDMVPAGITQQLAAEESVAHDAAYGNQFIHATGKSCIEQFLKAVPNGLQRPAAHGTAIGRATGYLALGLRFRAGIADFPIAAKDAAPFDVHISLPGHGIEMHACGERKSQGDTNAVDKLSGTDVAGPANAGNGQSLLISNGIQKVRRPAR